MEKGMRLRNLFAWSKQCLREIIFPEGAVCLGCGKLSDGKCLCPSCREELLHSDMLESWELRDLKGVPAWSMRPHRGLPRKLVLQLKHGAVACAVEELAGILKEKPSYFPAMDLKTIVTWVPAPKARTRERGIDHGRLLAEAVGRELGLKCRPLLKRRGNDVPQARLSREARQKNLKKAFAAERGIDYPVLLVDDVLTTGTTALRCISALREAGASEITVLTATRAVREKGTR